MNNTYRLIEEREIKEQGGTGCVYEHIRTGARVFTIKNSDKNKVFMIGFRTTPKDSTGVAHIMEHSVLCGSEKFPLKDPFVELAKGSLNTFLNAMTYPDKTVYPVASVNDKDFMNLMDVYLDAVFHPNIGKDSKVFRQEGWHYEMEDKDSDLCINGVVYNEMKGVYSNPDSVLESYQLNTLYPDTTYSYESGGAPEVIPQLSYEQFLAFHDTYYHPSNSYIYLYGNMDMEEKLMWIDEHYLSSYVKAEVHSEIARQENFAEEVIRFEPYAVGENEETENRTYLSENYALDIEPTMENTLVWDILESILLEKSGAEITEALIKAGIGEDIYGGFTNEIQQPFFSIVAKNAEKSDTENFRRVIRETLESLVRNGISKKSLNAELNSLEFELRENDYGRIPAGLHLGLEAFGSWLYDKDPFEFVCYEKAIESIRAKIETDFFERVIEEQLLHNKKRAFVGITPEQGLTAKRDAELAERMAALKAELSEEEIEKIVSDTHALRAFQDSVDSEEKLAMLPVLNISDIDRKARTVKVRDREGVIYSPTKANGIVYGRMLFDLAGFEEEELCYAQLIAAVQGKMNTSHYSYKDYADEVLLHTGGISGGCQSYDTEEENGYAGVFSVTFACLEDKIDKTIELSVEPLLYTDFEDGERLLEILKEDRSYIQSRLEGAAHMAAMSRSASYFQPANRFADLTAGIAYMDFVEETCRKCEEEGKTEEVIGKLREVSEKLFVKSRLRFAVSCREEAWESFLSASRHHADTLPEGTVGETGPKAQPAGNLNEGLKSSSQVNYVARCGSFGAAGLRFTGALNVLRIMLNYDYLWINLRVKGGAYGCMSGFSRNGTGYLVSYRDPHVGETNEIYEQLPDYLEKWDCTELELRKYIIGAISSISAPMSPATRAGADVGDYYSGIRNEDLQQYRDEMLDCTAADIRALSAHIRAILQQDAICTIGNAALIDKDSALFKNLREFHA